LARGSSCAADPLWWALARHEPLGRRSLDGGPAFFERLETGYTGFPEEANVDEWVVVGDDVYNVDAFYNAGRPRLTPKAATLALITRVEATG
jgi:hypothetical protein